MHAQLRDNNQGIIKITSGALNRWALAELERPTVATDCHTAAAPTLLLPAHCCCPHTAAFLDSCSSARGPHCGLLINIK